MRLLIVTQKVDSTDPILGFFHGWLLEFAKHCDELIVIGQSVGTYNLPKNVRVFSLKKEKGYPKFLQILRFWWLQLRLAFSIDAVLVHMTPIWVLIGAKMWVITRRPIYLWYEVRRGGWVLEASLFFVHKVFSATAKGLPFISPKNVVVGHGIDTTLFAPGTEERDPHLLVTIGRVTRIKHFDVLLECLAALPPEYSLSIVGGIITKDDQKYLLELQTFMREHQLENRVTIQFRSQQEISDTLKHARLFLHAAGGGLDKVVLEAMACECAVLTCSEAAATVLPVSCTATLDTMVERTKEVLAMSLKEQKELGRHLREKILQEHNLPVLINRLMEEMK